MTSSSSTEPRDTARPARAPLRLVPSAPLPSQLLDEASDCEFVELLGRFRDSGGLANLAEVESLVAVRGRLVPVTGAVAAHRVLAFAWQGTYWLPLFQFCLVDMALKPGVDAVLSELSRVFDRVTLARWFLQSNCSLRGRSPVQVMDVDPDGVLGAARLDRFVAAG